MKTQKLAKLTLWANRAVMAVVAVLIFALPTLLRWYADLLGYYPPKSDLTGIWIAYILCACVIGIALFSTDRLLRNILAGRVFVRENVRQVRIVQHCCGIVATVCVCATFFALPMLLFAAIMGFLSLVVCVLAQVLDAAVVLQEESDLTI